MAPHDIPPFSWGTANDFEPYDLRAFLQMVRKVMARRDVELLQKPKSCCWKPGKAHDHTPTHLDKLLFMESCSPK